MSLIKSCLSQYLSSLCLDHICFSVISHFLVIYKCQINRVQNSNRPHVILHILYCRILNSLSLCGSYPRLPGREKLWTTASFRYFGAGRTGAGAHAVLVLFPRFRCYARRLRTCRRSLSLSQVGRVVRGVVRCSCQMS